jgi:hypothetical protein
VVVAILASATGAAAARPGTRAADQDGVQPRGRGDHVIATTEWTFGICESIARSISRRREHLVAYYENLQQEIDGTADPPTASEQQRYTTTFNERLDKCEALGRSLERIGRDITRDFPGARR